MNEKALAEIRQSAARWVLLQRDDAMSGGDWEAFAVWLSEDDQHRRAYEDMLEADADLDALAPHVTPPAPEEDAAPVWRRFSPYWGGIAAAAAMLLAAILLWPQGTPTFRSIETAAGETRDIAIGEDIMLALNGGTQVMVAEGEPVVRLTEGEAAFVIESEDPSSLRVEVDDLVLFDYGTVFNVVRDEDSIRIAVAEGAVMINPDAEAVLLEAGEQAEKRLGGTTIERGKIDPAAATGWRSGRLAYDGAPVSQVVSDVERNLGTHIALSDALAGESLTGVISLAGDDEHVLSELAGILGGRARKVGEGWRID